MTKAARFSSKQVMRGATYCLIRHLETVIYREHIKTEKLFRPSFRASGGVPCHPPRVPVHCPAPKLEPVSWENSVLFRQEKPILPFHVPSTENPPPPFSPIKPITNKPNPSQLSDPSEPSVRKWSVQFNRGETGRLGSNGRLVLAGRPELQEPKGNNILPLETTEANWLD